MPFLKPKKSFGQHFLIENGIAKKIVSALGASSTATVVEIGPGKGVLSTLLEKKYNTLYLIELDKDAVVYLHQTFPQAKWSIIQKDCLQADWSAFGNSIHLIGNFPYNISSQILFKVLAHRDQVQETVCMLQQEVAARIAGKPGSKTYGLLSVLLQTWYQIEYLFSVESGAFQPPPKVTSAVLRLVRNQRKSLPCTEKFYTQVVKTAFQHRRKTLRNAFKPLHLSNADTSMPIFSQRAEQLSATDFIELATYIESTRDTTSI